MTERDRIIATLTAAERSIYRRLGGTIPAYVKPATVEWLIVDRKKMMDEEREKDKRQRWYEKQKARRHAAKAQRRLQAKGRRAA